MGTPPMTLTRRKPACAIDETLLITIATYLPLTTLCSRSPNYLRHALRIRSRATTTHHLLRPLTHYLLPTPHYLLRSLRHELRTRLREGGGARAGQPLSENIARAARACSGWGGLGFGFGFGFGLRLGLGLELGFGLGFGLGSSRAARACDEGIIGGGVLGQPAEDGGE